MATCQNNAHTYCHTTCCQMINISNYICTSNNIGKPAYIRYVCLQPFCHSIKITWRFIWEGAINRLCHLLHGMECKGVSTNKTIAASWMNHHIIWIGWQQGCTHVSWLHLFTGLNSAIENSVINMWLKIIEVSFQQEFLCIIYVLHYTVSNVTCFLLKLLSFAFSFLQVLC